MSVVVVLVLLLFSFPVDWGGGKGACPLVLCSLLLLSVLDRLHRVWFCKYEIGPFMFCRNSLSFAA